MRNRMFWVLIFLPLGLIAQSADKSKDETSKGYDITEDKVLYTIGYSHLDTEWRWTYKNSINEFIKNTMDENFYLFEKYPEYTFNFTGSRRYKMMKEYYPERFEKVKKYVDEGRWFISGSSVDESEVTVSSSESVIRHVLYGNNFFQKEFGKTSKDYMLPDCFGFVASLPSAINHTGLIGFSTQKLTWGSAVGIPFNIGVWKGPDGKGIVSVLNATKYTGGVENRLDNSKEFYDRLEENYNRSGYGFDFRYYGIGDQGGAPRENDVRNAIESLDNPDGKMKVVLASSDQMFKDITPEIREKLPTYQGDLLLTEHSAGTLTSQAFMKRMNRKNENLAQSAEQMSSLATLLTGAEYPQDKINNSWELVLGSQMHDILPGTAIPEAYELAWNDEFIANKGFEEPLKNALSIISSQLNTNVQGRSVSVYNPVAFDREDVVTAELEFEKMPQNIQVFDKNQNELPSQVISKEGKKLKIIFLAQVPSVGVSVFDVRSSDKSYRRASQELQVTENSLENRNYKVVFDKNGDITSIYDKNLQKELLLKPARLEFLFEKPSRWPAWNMDWEDRQNSPIDFLDSDAEIKIVEQGPVRVALEIIRQKRNSKITQVISLSAGNPGNRIEFDNKLNWQSKEVSLKASFPFSAENEKATYNLGVGAVERENNDPKKYEVPSKGWFDLTDKSGEYGISILQDSKFGSDKPDDNTLRLTLLYTPGIDDGRFWHQATQDWGIHDIRFALHPHRNVVQKSETAKQAEFFEKPLIAYETPQHKGVMGKELSLISFDSEALGLMAFKKAENSDYFIVRVNELKGEDQKDVTMRFAAPIEAAYEVNGQEQKIGDLNFSGKTASFDMGYFGIKSFAVKFKSASFSKMYQKPVELPFNEDIVTFDDHRLDANSIDNNTKDMFMYSMRSYPAELFPETITSEGIMFEMGDKQDRKMNVVGCKGQKIQLPKGNYDKLYLLAAATEDVTDSFYLDEKKEELSIQKWTGFIGQFYDREFNEDETEVLKMNDPYFKKSNIAWFSSHHHDDYPSRNVAYEYAYIFKYAIDIPKGATSIQLPDNDKIKVFAITAAPKEGDDVEFLQPLTEDFSDNEEYRLIEGSH
ncbi:glycoside hydrolase family 38 C-terminal domain-containing protein [Zunongwangia sp. F363]|uniref:Glycoside hydrolase family 38 C-terminal domain-containing protein n=1 Tax=Autumnicola tepida TaxID=3075595 RepID=A0ABU3C917_9FLAO|nr:glycoside hydrolase family 38 C-terminal domain-containing protein [Zunongwangia sp. F363]MDT0642763.1 glycoside hydrolase family 38 C-terminal domain-containing protein [Zunongwangia sp. F363]